MRSLVVLVAAFTLCWVASAQAQSCAPSIQSTAVAGISEKEDNYKLNVILGCISQEKFNELHTAFGTAPAKPYEANRSYNLTEFFPTFIAQVNGKNLTPHTVPVPQELISEVASLGSVEANAYVDANCHSVTWQWINHVQGMGSPQMLFMLVHGDNLLGAIAPNDTLTKEQLKIGDIVIVQGNGSLQQQNAALHSAIYVGDGLVFEKTNPGELYPYRIARLDDLMNKYRKVDSAAIFHFNRPKNLTSKLPTLVGDLGLGNPTQLADLGISFQNTPAHLKTKYALVAEFDTMKMEYTYLFARLLTPDEAGEFLK